LRRILRPECAGFCAAYRALEMLVMDAEVMPDRSLFGVANPRRRDSRRESLVYVLRERCAKVLERAIPRNDSGQLD
jgi:hypothetical protein